MKESMQELFDRKLKLIQQKTFLSIQNVNNTVQEANKKITRNTNYINLIRPSSFQFFSSGKTYLFRRFKNISMVLYLAYTKAY